MKLGVFTVVYGQLPLAEALDKVVALGLDAVEIGTGSYPGDAHNVPALADEVRQRGLEISALSCHGNPLHPQAKIARDHHNTFLKTVELAQALEVDTVITFAFAMLRMARAAFSRISACTWSTGRSSTVEALVAFLVTTYSSHGITWRSCCSRSSPETKISGTPTRPHE